MCCAAQMVPTLKCRSRLSHRPSDLLYLSRSSSFSIHPHNFYHLGRLLLSAFLFPPSSLFIRLRHYLNLFSPPACLVFTSRSFSSPHPPMSGNFSQPPHPLIFHQGCSTQTNMGCNLSPDTPPHSCFPPSLSVRGTNAFVQYLQQTD